MCPLPTQFAPAERGEKKKVSEQASAFLEDFLFIRVLDAVTTPVLILNEHRQIVYANRSFLDLVQATNAKKILGLRPGEALGCIHADTTEGGCGTTEFCRECGAARAILSSIKGDVDVQECRISLTEKPNALDLRVMASPIKQNGESYTVFSITDIADEKRREILERIFLHDILNTAGGLQGFSKLLFDASEEQSDLYKKIIHDLSDRLVDEINAHKQLLMAENNNLKVQPVQVKSLELLEGIRNLYMNHNVARNKNLRVDQQAEDLVFISDATILSRVIGNMIKNALEAIGVEKTVTLSCKQEKDNIIFTVHNPGVIPRDAQLQIFQRSFSTKGTGRGLGTYSIKLLSEQYLMGHVGFTSSERDGTLFYGEYPLHLQN